MLSQVCEGLDDAHRVGVVHRDVKPGNVLLHERPGGLYVHLCDFGIALSDAGTTTRSGVLVGSVPYMAPERHEGDHADERSDVYAAGCLLFHVLTGRPPFEAADVQVAMAHLHQPVPALTAPGTEHLDEVVQRATAKDPDDRFGSAAELREALLAADPPRPLLAVPRPRGVPRRAGRPPPATGALASPPPGWWAQRSRSSWPSWWRWSRWSCCATTSRPGPPSRVRRAAGSSRRPGSPAAAPRRAVSTARPRPGAGGGTSGVSIGDGATEERLGPVRVQGEGWEALSTGYEETCGVRTDATAWCWGAGVSTPRRLPGQGWESVVVRQLHTCGLREGGTIWCWGLTSRGSWGTAPGAPTRGRTGCRATTGRGWRSASPHLRDPGRRDPLVLGEQRLRPARGRDRHAAARAHAGARPGVDLAVDPGRPHLRRAGRRDRVVLGAQRAGAARRRDDRPATRPCPGAGHRLAAAPHRRGQHLRAPSGPDDLVLGRQRVRSARRRLGGAAQLTDRLPGTVWTGLALGHSHVCAKKVDDTVWCWGRNHEGQLGDGTRVNARAPSPVTRDGT